MGTAAQTESAVPPFKMRRPRTVVAASISAVVLVLAATVIVLVRHVAADREASRYSPLDVSAGGGVWFGPDPDSSHHLGGEIDSLHLTGPAGTEQRFLAPLTVDGDHDVDVLSVTGEGLVSHVQWSKYTSPEGSYISGTKQPWHEFPVTVEAHQVVRLGIIMRKPGGCGKGLSRPWNPTLVVKWRALDRTHTDYLEAATFYSLYGCG